MPWFWLLSWGGTSWGDSARAHTNHTSKHFSLGTKAMTQKKKKRQFSFCCHIFYINYGRTWKFFVKPFNPLRAAPREAGWAPTDGRAHLNPPSSWDQVLKVESHWDPAQEPERMRGKESFSQGPAPPGFPTFVTQGHFPYMAQGSRVTFQCRLLASPDIHTPWVSAPEITGL